MNNKSILLRFIPILLLIFLLTGCDQGAVQHPGNKLYGLEKNFREFYKKLGGVETLGPIISESITWDANECQYTENALMCFNANYEENNGFFLFPLAAMFGVQDGDQEIQGDSDLSNTTSNFIEFQKFYETLGGEAVIGKMITPIRFNFQEKRIEQYFENIGFYRLMSEKSETVHLLAYGAYACKEECRFTPESRKAVNVAANTILMPFLNYITKFGNLDTFGEPLSAPIELQSGVVQQVFQNVVFIGNPNLPETIHLVDISIKLGLRQDEPGPQIYNQENNMVFYVVNSPNGFHVPLVFDDFVTYHGGRELSGNPISEVYYEGETIRQCFQNYCLDYQPNDKKVMMVPLGKEYLEVINPNPNEISTFEYSPDTVTIQVQEKAPNIKINETQELLIKVFRADNSNPIQNIDGNLRVTLPNGSELNYTIDATDEFGTSIITIPANKRMQNGSVLSYRVCMNIPNNEPLCIIDSYLIW